MGLAFNNALDEGLPQLEGIVTQTVELNSVESRRQQSWDLSNCTELPVLCVPTCASVLSLRLMKSDTVPFLTNLRTIQLPYFV